MTEDHIYIRGPDPTTRYIESVESDSPRELEYNVAVKISHLARFSRVFNLRGRCNSILPQPFKITWPSDVENGWTRHTFELRNLGKDKLFVTLINLGPGYSIKQLNPPNLEVARYDPVKICVSLDIPSKLKATSLPGTKHRDVIRALVTRGGSEIWTSLELSHIWDAVQTLTGPDSGGRDVKEVMIPQPGFSQWTHDHEIFTTV